MAVTVQAPFNTSTAYSGSFIPQLWSKKLNAKYYVDNQLVEVTNTNWQGEINSQGDSVRIRTAPTLTISDYTIGGNLAYEVPVPIYQDLTIDKGKSFAFQVSDVLAAQADVDLMNMFMEDAAKQLKISITDEVFYTTFIGATPNTASTTAANTRTCHASNQGATAGVKSAALNLGTDLAPIDTATPANLLALILNMGAALDEQNVPESGRWLIMSPYDRQVLMNTTLAQAYFTGDSTSIVRTGKIGRIDRFDVYVSNMLPRADASKGWVAGSGDPAAAGATGSALKRRCILAGTKDAISFANQISKTENVPNPTDFGTLVRGLSIYGRKVVKPEALALGVVK